ncbi:MAG TPA: hypothetical protein VMS23_06050 [Terrimicrobiaceae bacterium]|nr:hypothetical protein [Terrimicrobiaceae bacterium]
MLTRLRSAARRQLAWAGRHAIGPLIFKLHKPVRGPRAPVSVHTLVSSETWDAGILAAISFESFSARSWPFFIHDDGSVTASQRLVIERTLPGARFIPRPEADKVALDQLASYPKSLSNRGRHNLSLKFFDFPAHAPYDRFLVLDSDVIFFKRPTEILDWVDSGKEEFWFNEDTGEKYCSPRPQIENALRMKIWEKVNTGICLVPKSAISLELGERLIAAFETSAHHPQFFEQTLYALMASAHSRGGMLPSTYNISWGYLRAAGSVCRHYVGAFKHDLLYIEGAPSLLGLMAISRLLRRN